MALVRPIRSRAHHLEAAVKITSNQVLAERAILRCQPHRRCQGLAGRPYATLLGSRLPMEDLAGV